MPAPEENDGGALRAPPAPQRACSSAPTSRSGSRTPCSCAASCRRRRARRGRARPHHRHALRHGRAAASGAPAHRLRQPLRLAPVPGSAAAGRSDIPEARPTRTLPPGGPDAAERGNHVLRSGQRHPGTAAGHGRAGDRRGREHGRGPGRGAAGGGGGAADDRGHRGAAGPAPAAGRPVPATSRSSPPSRPAPARSSPSSRRTSRRPWPRRSPPAPPGSCRSPPASPSPPSRPPPTPAVAVVRAMPNTPALVGQGASAIAGGTSTTDDDLAWAERILGAVGTVERVRRAPARRRHRRSPGSGPAYVFLVAEALIDAGVAAGLPRPLAERLDDAAVRGLVRAPRRPGRPGRAAGDGHLTGRHDGGRVARRWRPGRCGRRSSTRWSRRPPAASSSAAERCFRELRHCFSDVTLFSRRDRA